MSTKIPRTEFIQNQLDTPQRESKFGYHFIMDYAENPYHFYLRYVLGIKPEKTGKALLFGGSIHTAIESFYTTSDPDPIDVFNQVHAAKASQYFSLQDHADDMKKGNQMLNAWMSRIPMEEAESRVLVECEKEHNIILANGFPMTIRPDRVMEDIKTGVHYLKEVKTTGWSIMGTFDNMKMADQVTTYLMGYLKATGKKAKDVYVEPEILYARQSKSEVATPGFILRNPYELQRNEMALIGWYGRLYSSLKMLEAGYPPELAFPRNSTTNRKFPQSLEGLMEYSASHLKDIVYRAKQAPDGYVLDERVTHGLIAEFKSLWEKTHDYERMEDAYKRIYTT